tara:strand:- start:43 stop:312 length:270 start_codon:yes stop_codon:yes gene_type:complete
MSKAKELIESLDEVKDKGELVLNHFKQTVEELEKVMSSLSKDYFPNKFSRRIKSDYAGNNQKLGSIFKKITSFKKAVQGAVEDIKNEVG